MWKINDQVHDSRNKIVQLLSVDTREGQCSDDDVPIAWCVGDLHLCRSIVFGCSIVAAKNDAIQHEFTDCRMRNVEFLKNNMSPSFGFSQ